MNNTKPIYHSIDFEYRNEYGQHIVLVGCPVAETTITIVNNEVKVSANCTCGHRL